MFVRILKMHIYLPVINKGLMKCFLASTKATVSSMTSTVAPCTVAAEASRATRCLTIVPGSKATREPTKQCLLIMLCRIYWAAVTLKVLCKTITSLNVHDCCSCAGVHRPGSPARREPLVWPPPEYPASLWLYCCFCR